MARSGAGAVVIVLGIETATAEVGVALGDGSGVLAAFSSARGRRHAETLAPAIEFVCAQAGVELTAVGAIAVDVGPGLYTGLRVGVATAKALAQALGIQITSVPSLDLLAFPLRHTERVLVPVVDARRGEVFWALYRGAHGGVQRLSPYRLSSPSDLASELRAGREDCLVVGDGALRYAELLGSSDALGGADPAPEIGGIGSAHPSAAALVELAHPKALSGELELPGEVEPLYLRKPDAAINWEQRRPPALDAGAASGPAVEEGA